MPTHDEVERAIRSVPGVAEATVSRAHDTGRGRLRIRLHPGEDAERVSWSVAATLRERFGIALDPEEIRPRLTPGGPAEEPGFEHGDVETPELSLEGRGDGDADGDEDSQEPTGPATGHEGLSVPNLTIEEEPRPAPVTDEPVLVGAVTGAPGGTAEASAGRPMRLAGSVDRSSWRPTIRDLSSRNDGTAVTVTARLVLDGRIVAGEAAGAPTARGLRRAIADATVRAVGELTRSTLRAQVDRVSVGGNDPAAVTVVVSLLSGRGEELLLGAAIVHDDVEHAIMRATLDALNRRVEPELVG